MATTDQFNIRWNNYTTVLQNVFRKLLDGEQFVDVTLACEGQSIKCHRLILSACSTYFDRILSDNPSSNLVIYLKDMKFWELRALVTFMYNGEVSISQQKLPHLCKAAEALKVKGLAHDTTLTDGDMDRLDDDLDDYPMDNDMGKIRDNHRMGSIAHQKSLLRQHNTLSSFAAAAAGRPSQQIKRKIVTQPPKLVKMQRVERPINGTGSGNNASGKPSTAVPAPTLTKLPIKKAEPEANKSAPAATATSESVEGEVKESSTQEDVPDVSPKEESIEKSLENGDMEVGGDDDLNSIASDGEDSQPGQAGKPNKLPFKYGREVRDTALNALHSGMTLRDCSEAYGVPKKTLSKWKSREPKTDMDEECTSPINKVVRVKEEVTPTGSSIAPIVLPPKTTAGAPIDSADRAERLKKATELALSGVTVRQAAAHYDIPRTTLCAYMKRRGLAAAKKNVLPQNGPTKRVIKSNDNNSRQTNGQSQGVSSHYEDFPFLGISELMDEMGGNYEEENYDGEEEYSEKSTAV